MKRATNELRKIVKRLNGEMENILNQIEVCINNEDNEGVKPLFAQRNTKKVVIAEIEAILASFEATEKENEGKKEPETAQPKKR